MMQDTKFKAYPVYAGQPSKYADYVQEFAIETKADRESTLDFIFKHVFPSHLPTHDEWKKECDNQPPSYYYKGYYTLIPWENGTGYTFMVIKPYTD